MTQRITSVLARLVNLGVLPQDSQQERLKKAVLTIVCGIIAVLAILWGSLYFLIGYRLSGAIPLAYSVVSFISIAYFFATKRFAFFRFSQLLLILLLPFLLQWSLGGFANGSAVMVWAFFAPLSALFFADSRSAARWLAGFLFLLVVSGFIDSTLASSTQPMLPTLNTLYFIMNLGCGFGSIYIVLHYVVRERDRTYREALIARDKLEAANLQLQQNEAKIRDLMLSDPLTGVANRRHLDERLSQEIIQVRRYKASVAVIMADLDNFKEINDRWGHTAGDSVLRVFAQLAKELVRGSDFVARFGGEEFVLLLPRTSEVGAVALAERMRQEFEQKVIAGVGHSVTASFGVTTIRADEEPDEVLRRVDEALYEAKRSGRNRIVQQL